MAETSTPHTEAEGRSVIDWEEIERSDAFQELVSKRRSFVIPATIFFLAWYMGFIILAAYAPDFMAESVYEGLTVGYVLALTQFLMVLVLGLMYLSRSSRVYDPLAEKAIAAYQDTDTSPEPVAARAASATREPAR